MVNKQRNSFTLAPWQPHREMLKPGITAYLSLGIMPQHPPRMGKDKKASEKFKTIFPERHHLMRTES